MQRGKCKLCLKDGDLQESHLIPAAVYKMCRPDSGEITDPVGIRNDPKTKTIRVFRSSRQITGHVLCSACEQILNINGEDWVLPQLSTLQGFHLYDKLTSVAPEMVDGDVAAYASAKVPDVRTDFLTHFAMGIFWKAGVHNWQTGHESLRLELGPYQEEIRRFLLGELFPKHAWLMVCIVPPSLPTVSTYMPFTRKAEGFPSHFFYVPGIEFMLTLGKRIPDYLRAMCIASNPARLILVGTFPAQFIAKRFAEAFQQGHIPAKLAGRLRRVPVDRA